MSKWPWFKSTCITSAETGLKCYMLLQPPFLKHVFGYLLTQGAMSVWTLGYPVKKVHIASPSTHHLYIHRHGIQPSYFPHINDCLTRNMAQAQILGVIPGSWVYPRVSIFNESSHMIEDAAMASKYSGIDFSDRYIMISPRQSLLCVVVCFG